MFTAGGGGACEMLEFFAESEEDFHDKLIVTMGTHAILNFV